jgi:hypothetical protein
MVLTKTELVDSLKDEVRILLHLASKVDRAKLDYRPSAKQRSTLELLQYLSFMGPAILDAGTAGKFDGEAWTKAEQAAASRTLDQALEAIAAHPRAYESQLSGVTDDDMRVEIEGFGNRCSRGSFIVNQVIAACAAYRTQLFLYLKACGREELSTWNLWGGTDPPKTT